MPSHARLEIVGSITEDSDTDGNTTAVSSHTLSAGQNRTVFVCVGAGDNGLAGDDVTGVTYGGVAMTQVNQVSNTNGTQRNSTGIYYLKVADSVAAGAKTVTVTAAGNISNFRHVVFELANVDPTTVLDTTASTANSTGVSSQNQSRTTVTDRAWILQAVSTDRDPGDVSPTGGQSTISANTNVGAGYLNFAVYYLEVETPGATSMPVSISAASDVVGMVVGIRPRRRKIRVS